MKELGYVECYLNKTVLNVLGIKSCQLRSVKFRFENDEDVLKNRIGFQL